MDRVLRVSPDAPGIGNGIAKPPISFISAVPHTMLDFTAAHTDVFEPVIIHRRNPPHVASDAQLSYDRRDDPPKGIEQGNSRRVGDQSLQKDGSFHRSLHAQRHVGCLGYIYCNVKSV
jgi:hypothetical protein